MVRVKNRYVTFQILYPDNAEYLGDDAEYKLRLYKMSAAGLDTRVLNQIFQESLRENFGEFGDGVVGSSLKVKYFSGRTSTGIVKVSRDDCVSLCFAMSCVNKIGGQNVIVRIVKTSGTIRKAQDFLIANGFGVVEDIEKLVP